MARPLLERRVRRDALDPLLLLEQVRRAEAGAVVLFLGTVRAEGEAGRVKEIEYECYEEMAEEKLREIERRLMVKWGLQAISIAHRIGRLSVGDISVVVAVSSRHRAEAFGACREAIERIKREVPIWKKELLEEGGSRWVEGHALEEA
ncbi:MAG: hypothetical protein C4339_03225 [Nitrososphaerota archaeon]